MDDLISVDELRRLLDYDPDTGIFRWKVSMHGSRGKGGIAGCKRKQYWAIAIYKRAYCAHRLAWLYIHGRWPTCLIDHINMDGMDNRLVNLREATHSQNHANATKNVRNTSGFKGVILRSDGKAWCARICKYGKRIHLGRFATKEEAWAAYAAASVSLNGEFARF